MTRILLAGGGSGGHVFPALAVASTLQRIADQPTEFLFAGAAAGIESELAASAGIPFAPVAARAVRGRNPASQAVSAATAGVGVLDALGAIRRFRPHAVFLTGGYVSAPVGVAAWLMRRPIVLFQPDVAPGWALRMLAPLATRACVTHESAVPRYGDRAVVTGYPIRDGFRNLDQPLARAHFQLNGGPALLVTGAVRGAQRINGVIADRLAEWLETAQLIHISGETEYGRLNALREQLEPRLASRYRLYPYLSDDMPLAMAACDLAISRAGASVIGEYPAAGLPAVLAPIDEAGGHQRFNAEALRDAGAAVIVDNEQVETDLFDATSEILRDPEQLRTMRDSVLAMQRLDGAEAIARVLLESAS